jgi:hypothetical protein
MTERKTAWGGLPLMVTATVAMALGYAIFFI